MATERCERCEGRMLIHPKENEPCMGDEKCGWPSDKAIVDCPDCNGTGRVEVKND